MLQMLGIKCEEGTEDFKKYNCDKCDYRTNDNGNFSRHMNSKHSAIAKETMLTISLCGLSFALSLSIYLTFLVISATAGLMITETLVDTLTSKTQQ